MIRAEGFTKLYGERLAVADLSFEVGAGEVLGLVGPNGAGKTTTLRALAGVLPPSRGRLLVAGYDIREQPLEAKRRLAIVPDDPHLFNSLTVWEHLEFVARVYRLGDWHERGERLLEEFEILDRRATVADELSRGMRQKTAMACALLHEPAVLLLDEPLTGLDPRGIRTLFAAVSARAARGAAVMISSHLLGQIEGVCSRFLFLREGRALLSGGKEELRARFPTLAADASLEEIFFEVTEGAATDPGGARDPAL